MVNSSYNIIAADIGTTTQRASYFTTIYILCSGVVPMFLAPLSNLYGRRLLYLVTVPIGIAANIGSAFASTYGGIVVGRAFNGIGMSFCVTGGAAVIADMFPMGERGLWLGFYALSVCACPLFLSLLFLILPQLMDLTLHRSLEAQVIHSSGCSPN